MGTNYYLVTEEGRKHIGKSSGGWCFSLHVYPEEDINDLQDWIPFWNQLTPDKHIEDEYGAIITGEGMLIIICERKSQPTSLLHFDFKANYAVLGPNFLARCELKRLSKVFLCIL